MPYSSSLTDQEWKLIEPLLPQKKQTRPPRWTKRQILDGIFYQLMWRRLRRAIAGNTTPTGESTKIFSRRAALSIFCLSSFVPVFVTLELSTLKKAAAARG
jgi:hypothetical protein